MERCHSDIVSHSDMTINHRLKQGGRSRKLRRGLRGRKAEQSCFGKEAKEEIRGLPGRGTDAEVVSLTSCSHRVKQARGETIAKRKEGYRSELASFTVVVDRLPNWGGFELAQSMSYVSPRAEHIEKGLTTKKPYSRVRKGRMHAAGKAVRRRTDTYSPSPLV